MKKCVKLLIIGMAVGSILFFGTYYGSKRINAHTFLEKLADDTDRFTVEELFPVAEKPACCFANQGFAIYNDVLFQLYNDNWVVLSNFRDGNLISQLEIVSLHGDTIDFSDEFYDDNDEFPLAYITADTNPAQIYVVRIGRTSTSLIRTYTFDDLEETGYYAGHCLDVDNRVLYMVGYKRESYYDPNDNPMIVSMWDPDRCIKNDDGTLAPAFLGSFEMPFIITVQGQRCHMGKLYLLSSHNGLYDVGIDTRIYIVDPKEMRIAGMYDRFPEDIRTTECEGIELIGGDSAEGMVLSTYSEQGGKYYMLK